MRIAGDECVLNFMKFTSCDKMPALTVARMTANTNTHYE